VSTPLDRIRGGLVVSCQAYPGEPMRDADTMARVAQACVEGGAVGIRAQGLDDIAAVKARVGVPVTGLWKDGNGEVFITPSLGHAEAVRDAGADIVALDGTRRPRPDGLTLAETVRRLKDSGDVLVMADCGSADDALAARDAGVDVVGTTLAGYTGERPRTDGPDLDLVERLTALLPGFPVVAEGRYATPAHVAAALDLGAYAVVVGTAITHPTTLTEGFVAAVSAPGA